MNTYFKTIILTVCLISFFSCGPDRDDIRGWYEDFESGKLTRSQAIEQITDALKSSNYDTRSLAAYYLGCLGDRRAFKPLIEIIKNCRECNQASLAIGGLGILGDPRAIDYLLPLMETRIVAVDGNTSRECYLVDEAIQALGGIVDPRAVDALIKKLNKKGGSRRYIFEALVKIGDVRAVDSIIISLNNGGLDREAWALGELNDPRAIEPLIAYLINITKKIFYEQRSSSTSYDRWKWQRGEAANAIGKFGSQAIKPFTDSILEQKNDEVRDDVFKTMLMLFEEQTIIDSLIVELKNVDPRRRSRTADLLGLAKSPLAVDPLLEALNDKDKKVRYEVKYALMKIGETSIEPLIEALNNENNNYKKEVISALGWVGGLKALEALISVSEDQNSDLKLNAARAICNINSSEAQKYIFDEVVQNGDLEIVAGIYGYLIGQGNENTIQALREALLLYGDKEMATAYLISENANLYMAASEWATKNGTDLFTTYFKGSSTTWGCRKRK
jgi:HEAT repeat protein